MTWYKNAVFYEVYIRAFCDSNADGHGDLPGLISRLDYLKEIGVDCLWVSPHYPSPLKDDGYDIADFYAIHPDYGTLADFQAFLAAAHAKGLRVITDLVLNHTSDQHPWFQAARSSRNSPYRDYYVWSDTPERYAGVRVVFCDDYPNNWQWDEQAGQYYWHRFHKEQPDLNYDNPAVCAAMLAVARFWLTMGVDGFRLDAVPYLYEREGTDCANLPETHTFLQTLRAVVDAEFPGRILLCEANLPPADMADYLGGSGVPECHLAFHFPLMPQLFLGLAQEDAAPIQKVLLATPSATADTQWCLFLRNHDELTLEMVTDSERAALWAYYAPEARMRLNLGIRRRLAPLLQGDTRQIMMLTAILCSLPGSPIIYYGDEIGMGDDIWLPDRNGVRTPMQWNDSAQAGFSTAEQVYAQPIATGPFAYTACNVAAQQANPDSLYWQMRHLLAARRPWAAVFGQGDLTILETPKPILAFWRIWQGTRLLCAYNLSAQTQFWVAPDGVKPILTLAAPNHGTALPAYGGGWWLAVD